MEENNNQYYSSINNKENFIIPINHLKKYDNLLVSLINTLSFSIKQYFISTNTLIQELNNNAFILGKQVLYSKCLINEIFSNKQNIPGKLNQIKERIELMNNINKIFDKNLSSIDINLNKFINEAKTTFKKMKNSRNQNINFIYEVNNDNSNKNIVLNKNEINKNLRLNIFNDKKSDKNCINTEITSNQNKYSLLNSSIDKKAISNSTSTSIDKKLHRSQSNPEIISDNIKKNNDNLDLAYKILEFLSSMTELNYAIINKSKTIKNQKQKLLNLKKELFEKSKLIISNANYTNKNICIDNNEHTTKIFELIEKNEKLEKDLEQTLYKLKNTNRSSSMPSKVIKTSDDKLILNKNPGTPKKNNSNKNTTINNINIDVFNQMKIDNKEYLFQIKNLKKDNAELLKLLKDKKSKINNDNNNEINKYKSLLEENNNKITEITSKKDNLINSKDKEINELKTNIEKLNNELKIVNDKLNELSDTSKSKDNSITELQKNIENKNNDLSNVYKDKKILEDELVNTKKTLIEQNDKYDSLNDKYNQKINEISELNNKIIILENEIKVKTDKISKLESSINDLNTKILNYENNININTEEEKLEYKAISTPSFSSPEKFEEDEKEINTNELKKLNEIYLKRISEYENYIKGNGNLSSSCLSDSGGGDECSNGRVNSDLHQNKKNLANIKDYESKIKFLTDTNIKYKKIINDYKKKIKTLELAKGNGSNNINNDISNGINYSPDEYEILCDKNYKNLKWFLLKKKNIDNSELFEKYENLTWVPQNFINTEKFNKFIGEAERENQEIMGIIKKLETKENIINNLTYKIEQLEKKISLNNNNSNEINSIIKNKNKSTDEIGVPIKKYNNILELLNKSEMKYNLLQKENLELRKIKSDSIKIPYSNNNNSNYMYKDSPIFEVKKNYKNSKNFSINKNKSEEENSLNNNFVFSDINKVTFMESNYLNRISNDGLSVLNNSQYKNKSIENNEALNKISNSGTTDTENYKIKYNELVTKLKLLKEACKNILIKVSIPKKEKEEIKQMLKLCEFNDEEILLIIDKKRK